MKNQNKPTAYIQSEAETLDALHLPDALRLADGTPVVDAEMWRTRRRAEILELFRTHVYGRVPSAKDVRLHFDLNTTAPGKSSGIENATRKQVSITIEGPKGKTVLNLVMFAPAKANKKAPAATFLLICHRGADNIDPSRAKKFPFWPAEEIVARGYVAAAFQVDSVAPDRDSGFKKGVFPTFDSRRVGDSWGTIAAWAWGASRAMDYLEQDAQIDPRRVAVVGHSRGGKAALWAGAEDERFAMAVSNDSGSTGAALARGKKGERITDINKTFPHWFCRNYRAYGGREANLPVDQHELLALLAPRRVYIASASEDGWADPENEFRACLAAEPVYRLFGLNGPGAARLPEPQTALHEGAIGYHLRAGKHDLTPHDWTQFMNYADRNMTAPKPRMPQ